MKDERKTKKQLISEIAGLRQQVANLEATKAEHLESVPQETCQKLSTVVEYSTNMFYAHTPEHSLTYLSSQCEQILGYKPAEAMVKWTELATDHPVNEKGFEITQRAIDTGQTQPPYELELQHKSGRKIWVEVRESPVVEDGSTVAIVGALTDITERKRALEKLQENETRYKALFSNMKSGVAIYNATEDGEDFIFADINQAGRELENIEREDVIGKSVLQVFQKIKDFGLFEVFQRVWKTGIPEHHPISLYEDERIVSWRENFVYKLPAGEIVAIYSDETEQVQAQKRIQRLLEQQLIVNQLTLQIGETLNAKKIYHAVYQHIQSLVDVWAFVVSLYNEEEQLIRAEYAMYKGSPLDVGTFPPIPLAEPGKGIQSRVIRTNKPFYTPDYLKTLEASQTRYEVEENGTARKGLPVEEDADSTRSALYLPMSVEGKTIGVIQLQSNALDAYTQEDINLMSGIANVAAVAVQNARLYESAQQELAERIRTEEKLRQAKEEITRLYNASGTMFASENQSLDIVAQIIVDTVLLNFEKNNCSLLIIDPETRQINRIAVAGIYAEEVQAGELTLDGSGLVPQAIRLGKIINAPNVTQSPAYVANWKDARSELAIPLKTEKGVIGVIDLQSSELGAFDAQDERVMFLFAERAALALENARLFQESQRQTLELSTLYESTLALSKELTPQLSLENLYNQVQRIFDLDVFLIALKQGNENARVAYVRESGKRMPDLENLTISPKDEKGLISWVLREQQPLLIKDMLSETLPVERLVEGPPARSWLCVPLIARDRLVGVISVQSFRPQVFSERHLRLLEQFAGHVAITLENARLFAETNRRMERLSSLRNIDRAITGTTDIKLTLDTILDEVLGRLGVDAADILIYEESLGQLSYASGHGFRTNALQHTSARVGHGYAGKAALRSKPIQASLLEQQDNPTERYDHFQKEGFISYYALSLRAKGSLIGVLEIFQRSPLNPTKEWENFVTTLAGQIAIAINNAKMFNDLKTANVELMLAYEATIEGWAHVLEMRDAETEGHCRRVVEMTMKLAWKLGIKDEKLAHIRRGALLHDIGKLAIPDNILQKSGTLNEKEWEIMRQHPVYAYDMLSSVEFLRSSLDIPRYHHERWDGTGYPEGLKETQIPFAARIFAIADTYDDLTSNRPYRDAWSVEKTLTHIKEQSGKHFDPHLVEVFLEIMRETQ